MEDHNATEPAHQPEDARALVAALTTLLVDGPSSALGTENRTNLIDRGTLATAGLPNLIDRRMSTSNSVNYFSSSRPDDEHFVYHDDEGRAYLCLVFFGSLSGLLRTCFGPSSVILRVFFGPASHLLWASFGPSSGLLRT